MALGYFWQKVDIVLYNSEVAKCCDDDSDSVYDCDSVCD